MPRSVSTGRFVSKAKAAKSKVSQAAKAGAKTLSYSARLEREKKRLATERRKTAAAEQRQKNERALARLRTQRKRTKAKRGPGTLSTLGTRFVAGVKQTRSDIERVRGKLAKKPAKNGKRPC